MGIRIKPKENKKKLKEGEEERLENTIELPETGYGLHTPGDDAFSPSTPNLPPEGTRYDLAKDQSVKPPEYEEDEESETRADLVRLATTLDKVKKPL